MSKTIQLWPSGEGVTFAGEYPHYQVQEKDGLIREGTEAEQRAIQRNELAANYAIHDVFCCDSSLVSDLLAKEFEGFAIDDIQNVYQNPADWDMERCRDYIHDYGGGYPNPDPWEMKRDELAELLNSVGIECRDDETDDTLRAAVIANMDDETLDGLDDWREAATELAQDNPSEAYEWWRVSQWLCNKLASLGEIVIDNDYGCWWGRSCTGQGMLMDGTLQEVASMFLD